MSDKEPVEISRLSNFMKVMEEDLNEAQTRLSTVSQYIIGDTAFDDLGEKVVSEGTIDSAIEKTKRMSQKVQNIVKMIALIESKL